jgi:hypothetical protein
VRERERERDREREIGKKLPSSPRSSSNSPCILFARLHAALTETSTDGKHSVRPV